MEKEDTQYDEERLMATISTLEKAGHIDKSMKALLSERHQERIQAASDPNDVRLNDTLAAPGYFHFIWKGSEHPIAFIRALKYCPVKNPGAFCIYDPVWSPELLSAIIDVFHHFAENRIYWNTLVLGHHYVEGEALPSTSCFEPRYTRPLLFVANAFSLFQRLEFWGESRGPPNAGNTEDATILFGAEWNIRLESILVQITGGIPEGDQHALNSALKKTTTLKELVLRCSALNHKVLCEGLTANTTLSNIDLDFRQPDVENDGVWIGTILLELAKHPNLKRLELATGHQCGDYSKELGMLLAASKSLKELALVGCTDKHFLDTDSLLKGLEAARSLHKLTIVSSLTGDLVFSNFFQMLRDSDCSLQVLSLWYLISENDLEHLQSLPRLQRPLEVEFHLRDLRKCESQLKDVLRCHPEIRLFGPIPDSLKHLTELNWNGRYLLNRPQAPISIWPNVLEHANQNPSVLYEWLKGPAFAGRDGHRLKSC